MQMLSIPDLLVLLGVGLGAALLGLFGGRRVHSAEQFLTAGRGASTLLVAVSLCAGLGSATLMVGAVGAFGYRGLGGLRPLLAVWLWLPVLLWLWAPVLQRSRLVTVPEYLGRRFDSRVRRFAAVALLGGLLGLAACELAAVGHTLRALTGQPAWQFAALTALGVTLWAAWGGMRAVLLADLLLGAVLLAGLGLLTGLALDLAGPAELVAGAPLSLRSLAPEAARQGDLRALSALVTDAVPLALAGLFGSQALTGRLAAARGERAAGVGLLIGLGPLGFLLLGGLAAAGLAGLLLADLGRIPAVEPAEVVLASIVGALGAPLTLGLLAALVLAAALSSLDALLVGAAALVVVDLAPGALPLDRERPGRARVATLAAGGVAFGLSILADALSLGLLEQGILLALLTGLPVGLVCLSGLASRRIGSGTALIALLGATAGVALGLGGWWTPGSASLPVEAALFGTGAGLLVLGAGWLRDRGQAPPSRPNLTWAELGPTWPEAPARLLLALSEPSGAAGEAGEAGAAGEAGRLTGPVTVRLPASLRASRGWEPGCEVVIVPARGAWLRLDAQRAVVGRKSAPEGKLELPAGAAAAAGLEPGQQVIVTRVA